MNVKIIAHRVRPGIKRIPTIKNTLAVTSGKGGVGKSTTAINLAIALANTGASVGILDADIYGPSLPILSGASDYKPEISKENSFIPLSKFGIKIMSFGFLVDAKQATIWRGAIVNKALEQLLYDTEWGELDYLIIDMPPGTGDIQLTMAQKFPVTATVVVTTPQDIALLDVGKSVQMFKKLDIPCLGVVENMAIHICSNCGAHAAIFGGEASHKLKQEYDLELLARLPLDAAICTQSDQGVPIASLANHPLANYYAEMATQVAQQLATLPKDYSHLIPGPSIVKAETPHSVNK
jgi:ATP-binding protein involved in chromosome partitioning